MGDPWQNPQARRWARSVLDDMLPKLRDSAVSVSLVPQHPDEGDVKFAVEFGFTLMLDKPVILMVRPGTVVPAKMLAVADAIVEYDPDDVEAAQDALQDALVEILPEEPGQQ